MIILPAAEALSPSAVTASTRHRYIPRASLLPFSLQPSHGMSGSEYPVLKNCSLMIRTAAPPVVRIVMVISISVSGLL
jgi:hypothetical protein